MQFSRRIVQIMFLAVFITLMFIGKAQYWMAFIFTSIVLAAFLGRFYCGWACPINTLIGPTDALAKKTGTQHATPSVLKSGIPRLIVFLVFLVGLGYTIYSITQGRKFPLPLIVIPFGLLVTLFINPAAWHRHLCPWGMFFSLTGRFSRHGVKTGKSSCSACTQCGNVCPGESITFSDKKAAVDPTNCLLCMACVDHCPKGALKYGHKETAKKDVSCPT